MSQQSSYNQEKVAVIGGGWNGAHIAASLARRGYGVTLYEGLPRIFTGISGTFGIRIHAGPHYPRSPATRHSCQRGFFEFCATYPELVNQHQHSIYAYAATDAEGYTSKITEKVFRQVCEEFQYKDELHPHKLYLNPNKLKAIFDINEPSAVLGPRLRSFFEKLLSRHQVKVKCNTPVTGIVKQADKTIVELPGSFEAFDHVINTTSYKQLVPRSSEIPLGIEVVYQPCLALVYEDLTPDDKPISFIVMDGWYPCLMPYDDRPVTNLPIDKYIMTHGKWTIMGSYDTVQEANYAFSKIDNEFVESEVRRRSEDHMIEFWPGFSKRFRYRGWKGAVLAKIKTNCEFRGSVVFQEPTTNEICVFPGKVTSIFDMEREVLSLIRNENVHHTSNGHRYVSKGVLMGATNEITEAVDHRQRLTCELQTFTSVLGSFIGDTYPEANLV
jgi:hypothetical protein